MHLFLYLDIKSDQKIDYYISVLFLLHLKFPIFPGFLC